MAHINGTRKTRHGRPGGVTVNLNSRITSPVSRAHLRKVYRFARGAGIGPIGARMLVARSVLAVQCEGDEGFQAGIRAEVLARRVAVATIAAGAGR